MADEQSPDIAQQEPPTFREFLEETPPGRTVVVVAPKASHSRGNLQLPDIRLHCDDDSCGGVREFTTESDIWTSRPNTLEFLTYSCRNCRRTQKLYALHVVLDLSNKQVTVLKIGEHPSFGPPTPSRVVTLAGDEAPYLHKGRRCEAQGLGIAAFSYYRRVVENKKNAIFDAIIKATEKVGGSSDLIVELEAAKKENQFKTAIGRIKHALPEMLLVDGHNPLTLLHSALSEGMHNQSDESCLELAASVRTVLFDLVDRVQSVLKADAELKKAVGRLTRT